MEEWIKDRAHRGMNDNCNQLRNSLQEPLLSDPLLISRFDSWASYEFANPKQGSRHRVELKYLVRGEFFLISNAGFKFSDTTNFHIFTRSRKVEKRQNIPSVHNKHTENSCAIILPQLQVHVSTNNTKHSEDCWDQRKSAIPKVSGKAPIPFHGSLGLWGSG